MDQAQREFDVVVYGATGFTGGLVAEYLLSKGELPLERWAIAGRDSVKLTELRARLKELDPKAADLTIIKASSDDAASLEAMCARTKVDHHHRRSLTCATASPWCRRPSPAGRTTST